MSRNQFTKNWSETMALKKNPKYTELVDKIKNSLNEKNNQQGKG